ncbi:MAG: PBP1A family penicillin-binding protein [Candidatus Cloacimonadota bacterium]|nr:PBP1A family penicillin-binding protein [Candidatus Cloacimonadota bacterium]
MKKITFWKVFFAVCCLFLFFIGILFALLQNLSKEIPPISELLQYEMKNGTKVYDNDGNLVKIFASEYRKNIRFSDMPDTLINAFVAIEDDSFFEHNGIDVIRLIKLVVMNVFTLKKTKGTSTITQQLARDMFLNRDQTYTRKIKEMMLAFQIERTFSKNQILEMYLNKTYLGGGNYGVESAAENYFGKPANELNLAECAVLARLPQAPSYLNPRMNYEVSIKRSKQVLNRMYELGYINRQSYYKAYEDSVKLASKKKEKDSADYYLEYIRKYIENKYGTSQLYNGGLSVYTPMDYDLTCYADSMLNNHIKKFENKMDYDIKYEDFPPDTVDFDTKYIQGGIFAINPNNGYVTVMIGGRNFNHSKFNRMMQEPGRQPGSAFKPFLYTAAMANGFTPATMINDLPVVFMQSDTAFWKPMNYSEKNYGLTSLRTALQHSRNIPAVQIINNISPYEVIKYARRCGIDSYLPPYLSLALGTCVVKPSKLITAYSVFANGGNRIEPIYIKRIENKTGEILEQNFPKSSRVISEKLAYMTNSLMQSVVNGGTAAGIRWRGFYLPAGGKTGTTDNFQDAWCIAFTRRLVLGIWVGFDDNITLGKGQAGAYVAVPPWPYIMNRAVANSSPKDSTGKAIVDKELYEFPRPQGIIEKKISKSTGLLAKKFDSDAFTEIFIAGTEPTILSDSLGYNFEPLGYQDLELDTLFIYMDKKD